MGIHGISPGGGPYYLADLAGELGAPPIRGSEGPGHWSGAGAEGLGLGGPVAEETLARVLSGRHPASGRELTLRRGAVGGFDLTFSAPKSVSVLFALGRREVSAEVVGAHVAAVNAAMRYVDRRALTVRRRSGAEREVIGTSGSVAAVFTHGVSRALDPHLHSHVVLANLAQGSDGRWSAIDGRGLFAHRGAAGALYEAQLRRRLTMSLGVEWEVRRNGRHEMADVGPEVLGVFSNRSAEIRARLAERGARVSGSGPSWRARQVAWAATRDAKVPGIARDDVAARWRAVSGDLEIGAIDEIAVGSHALSEPRAVDEHRFAASLAATSPVGTTRRGVVSAWAGALLQGASVDEVERSADWLTAYAGAPEAGLGGAESLGVREPLLPLARIVPSPHLLRALGPRPASRDHQKAWQSAADAIDRYRGRWGVTDRTEPLGKSSELDQLPVRQLADRLRTSGRVGEMLLRLGRDRAPALERAGRSIGRG